MVSSLGVLSCILLTLALSAHAQDCPTKCDCKDMIFRCVGLTELPANTFKDISVTAVLLLNSSLDTVLPYAFNNVTTQAMIMQGINVSKIAPRALNDVQTGSMDIKFGNIVTIEPNAFRNVTVSGDFNFSYCAVNTIQPNAFNNVSIGRMRIFNVNVTTIRPHAFSNNLFASRFEIFNAAINTLEDNAFNFTTERVNYSSMNRSTIRNLECHGLDGLQRTYDLEKPDRCIPSEGTTSTSTTTQLPQPVATSSPPMHSKGNVLLSFCDLVFLVAATIALMQHA